MNAPSSRRGVIAGLGALFVDSGQHLLAQPRDVMYLARKEEVTA